MSPHKTTKTLFALNPRIIHALVIFSMLLSVVGLTPVSAASSTRVMCENDTSLVGCWRMEEGTGTSLQDGGASPYNDGTLTNSPPWVTGKLGNWGLGFTSTSSQYVTIPDQASLNATNITVAAWIKPGVPAATQDLVKKLTGSAGFEFSLSQASAGQNVFLRLNNAANGRINSAYVYPTNGAWFHAAATYDGSTLKMYVNGAPSGTPVSYTGGIGAATSALTIGGVSTRYFTGSLDDVRIYNRALDATQISQLYANTSPFDGDTTAPMAPTGLNAVPGSTTVNLTWAAPADPDVKGYNVYRSESSSVSLTSPINGGTLVTGTSYTDTGRINGTRYYYVVTAVDTSANQSVASDEANATPFLDTTPPAAPTDLAATGGNKLVNLTWTANSESDLAGYNLYRGTTLGGPYIKVNTPLITGTSYTDNNLTNGTPYYYVLRAVDSSTNESGNSSEVAATPVEAATGLEF